MIGLLALQAVHAATFAATLAAPPRVTFSPAAGSFLRTGTGASLAMALTVPWTVWSRITSPIMMILGLVSVCVAKRAFILVLKDEKGLN